MIDLTIADDVAHVVLDAPEKLNALDDEALGELVGRVRRGRGSRCARARAARRGARVLRRPRHLGVSTRATTTCSATSAGS